MFLQYGLVDMKLVLCLVKGYTLVPFKNLL
jgi:hypothetical protein